MVALYLAPGAQLALDDLYESEPRLALRVDDHLDELELDPNRSRFRQRSLRPAALTQARVQGPLWGFTVRGQDQGYLVLWQQADDGSIDVQYVGPDL
jgi:hypothetical protein